MPYVDDGKSWHFNSLEHHDGMAENKRGHKAFAKYDLPKWVQHPIKSPCELNIVARDYAYGAGDGLWNQYNMSPAHIAAIFGDISLLRSCPVQSLSYQNSEGELPAHCAVRTAHAWVLQYLVEMGADVASKNKFDQSPDDLIHILKGFDDKEKAWLIAALDGRLTEKESVKAQEHRITEDRPSDAPHEVVKLVDRPEWFLKLRKFQYGTVDWDELEEVKFKPPPREEGLAKRDLPGLNLVHAAPIQMVSKPSLPCAMIFPDAGSEYVGVMKDVVEFVAVKALLDKSTHILGWDLKQLALEGGERLQSCKFSHPLAFVSCMAALELMRTSHGKEFDQVQGVAGLGLGEYSALVAADVLDFEDALRLITLRAEALDEALQDTSQSTCSIIGLSRDQLESLCNEAQDSVKSGLCEISGSLFPLGFVVGGTVDAVNWVMERARDDKAFQARLKPGRCADHTSIIQSTENKFGIALMEALPRMRPPRCCIYFNRLGKKVCRGAHPNSFIQYMREHLSHEVMWEKSMENMIADGIVDFFEVGPLKQLKAMLKRIDREASERMKNVSV